MKIQIIFATDTIVGSLFSKDPDITVGRMRFENPLAEVKGYH